MRITCDPPVGQWAAALQPAGEAGSAPRRHARPIVATGHQAWLWHPGIASKYFAAAAAAGRFDADPLFLIVDHDPLEALTIQMPVRRGDLVEPRTIMLAEHDAAIPTGCQPPVDANGAARILVRAAEQFGADLEVDVQPLVSAVEALDDCRTFAEQVWQVLATLLRPYVGDGACVYSSRLARRAGFEELVDQMLADAERCVRCYNRAAEADPAAGVASLIVQPHLVELPLWYLQWGRARQRVFADLGDARAVLVLGDGQPIEDMSTIAPRALVLSAYMRSCECDLFVHGRGGAAYDRVTEQWWGDWLGQQLSAKAMVSADAHLPIDAPVADSVEHARAVWRRHHLPHNLDRELGLQGDLVDQKRDSIAHMHDDRDRDRRAASFEHIHQINARFAADHPARIAEADRDVELTRAGLNNARVMQKRDWCFALCPPQTLRELADAFAFELNGA